MNIIQVDWLDQRAVSQREAMDTETTAMYRRLISGQTTEVVRAMQEAFAVDPSAIAVTLLALDGDHVLGHTALRPAIDEPADVLEVKKVYVAPQFRGRGISRALMVEAERLARERGANALVLQTGDLQVPAIRLYESLGYKAISPFGKYYLVPAALCYRKELN